MYVLAWHGLLAMAVALSILTLLQGLPYSPDLGAWYQGYTFAVLAAVLLLLIYGFRVAIAGQPLLRDELLDGKAVT